MRQTRNLLYPFGYRGFESLSLRHFPAGTGENKQKELEPVMNGLTEAMLGLIDPAVIGGTLAVVLFGGISAALAAGRWIGKRTIARYGPSAAPALGSLETAVFALLGLMIAFTFSGALSRFDPRRAQIVDEANAMGTAYLRIDLVPASAQPKLRETFRAYVDSRIETYRRDEIN